jgi:hypothetical protein
MKKLRVAFIGLAALAGIAMAPASAYADCTVGDCWGAVAYGPGGAWAWRVNYPSRAIARRAVLAACRGRCTQVLTFHNTCGAYASGPYGYGWGSHPNAQIAQGEALRQCNLRTHSCTLRVWGCTTR